MTVDEPATADPGLQEAVVLVAFIATVRL